MKLYFDQIPEGVSPADYPEGTEFVVDDAPMRCARLAFSRPPHGERG